MHLIELALEIAVNAHRGQTDLAGQPYILHPLRLAAQAKSTNTIAVAILHDVVEDTSVTLDDLRNAGIPEYIVNAVDCITWRQSENEPYKDYLLRVRSNDLSWEVKILDIRDNMNLARLPVVTKKDLNRVKKYHGGLAFLEGRASDIPND